MAKGDKGGAREGASHEMREKASSNPALARKLALRFTPYDHKWAQTFFQEELEQIARRRLKARAAEAIVVAQCSQFEVAVWNEILRLDADNGDAA